MSGAPSGRKGPTRYTAGWDRDVVYEPNVLRFRALVASLGYPVGVAFLVTSENGWSGALSLAILWSVATMMLLVAFRSRVTLKPDALEVRSTWRRHSLGWEQVRGASSGSTGLIVNLRDDDRVRVYAFGGSRALAAIGFSTNWADLVEAINARASAP